MSMNLILGFLMLVCIVPVLVMCFLMGYPKNWKQKKVVFGVKNREEWKQEPFCSQIDDIVKRYRKQAGYVLAAGITISVLLLFVPRIAIAMSVWVVFIFLILFLIDLPYAKGNAELKSIKREMGLGGNGITYVELQTEPYSAKWHRFLIPDIISVLVFILILLLDTGVLNISSYHYTGTFSGSAMVGSMVLVVLIMTPIAAMMERQRNEVISMDSDVNRNYNRAKKKIMSDTNYALTWISTLFSIVLAGACFIKYSEIVMIVLVTVYCIVMMAGLGFYVRKQFMVEKRYQREISLVTDDDDNWIWGLFYYNPNDTRVNVEKRVGIGSTINMATPMGKVVSGLTLLVMIGTLIVLIWVNMLEVTPIHIYVENETLICHQIMDDYVIAVRDMEQVQLLSDFPENKAVRLYGEAMDHLLKGRYKVGEDKTCELFLDPESGTYIRFEAGGTVYYISGSTAEETEEVFSKLK